MSEQIKNAGARAAAARKRGPVARSDYASEEQAKIDADRAIDARTPDDWMRLVSGQMAIMVEPSHLTQFHTRAARYLRPLFKAMDESARRRIGQAEQRVSDHYQAEIAKLKARIEQLEGPRL